MCIQIQRIETCIVEHALRPERVIVSSAGRHDTSRYLIVTVHGTGGLAGYGEAATTALWNGESAETAKWVVESLFAPQLTGRRFEHPREALAVMDAAAHGNPFAKSAVDTALWDLWARAEGVPVTALFADREPARAIPTRGSIGAYPVAETLRIACAFWEAGVRTLKFKIGVPGIDDAGRLAAVRDRFGDEPIFTVDANGAYQSADEALTAIEALLPYRLALLEQPTPRDRIRMLAEVRERLRIPILADECVFTPGHLAEALDCDAFDILSVYPGKNGGFTRSLDMAASVHRAGKVCAIGSNLETDLGQAAMGALAAGLSVFPLEATGGEEIACDLPAFLYYEQSSVTRPLAVREGRVEVPRGMGFGVEPRC